MFKTTALLDRSAMDKRIDLVWKKTKPEIREEYGEQFKEQCEDLFISWIIFSPPKLA